MDEKKELISIRGQTVEITELRWRDYHYAVKQLTETALSLLSKNGKAEKIGAASLLKEAAIELDSSKLLEAISKQETLVSWLIEKSCKGKDQNFVNDLSGSEALLILEKIVQLNLSPEFIEQGKRLAGLVGAAFGLAQEKKQ